MRNQKKSIVLTAVAAVIALAGTTVPEEADAARGEMEKCYGIAKANKNDCGTPIHPCAGQATKDSDPNEWVYLPKGACDKIVGGRVK